MAGKGKKSVLDNLLGGGDSDGDSDDSDAPESGSGAENGGGEDAEAAAAKKPKKELKLEDLQRQGYKSGPSVLLMKPPEEDGQDNWNWSNGREAKEKEPEHESRAEREKTREIASTGAEMTGALAQKAKQQGALLNQARRAERQEAKEDTKLTWNQKEKRKREQGKVSRGGSYVEDEKRVGRAHGVYSGFD
ncbi:hypothetical protein FOA52_015922 [Chlamydomonas sp. UWO 241]|nr:hypothetical protein FOA52_015922 [Chlamydomonas sp. UWO 241]